MSQSTRSLRALNTVLAALLFGAAFHARAHTEAPAKYVWADVIAVPGFEGNSAQEVCDERARRLNQGFSASYQSVDEDPDRTVLENGKCVLNNTEHTHVASPGHLYRCSAPEWTPTSTTASSVGAWAYFKGSQSGCSIPDNTIDKAKSVGHCETCSKNSPGAKVGNPITLSIGNKFQVEVDYSGSGAFPLQFARYYNSLPQLKDADYLLLGSIKIGMLWKHSYDRVIRPVSNTANSTAHAIRPDGKTLSFNLTSGVWTPQNDTPEKLATDTDINNPDGWVFTDAVDNKEIYDRDGRLKSISNRSGLKQTLAYDGSGRLSTVTDPFGRTLTFGYDSQNRINSMTDPAAGAYSYGYTGDNLTSVTYPGTQVRTYHYENTTFISALTGITDENNKRYATWGYDAQGRATSSYHGSSSDNSISDQVSIVYNGDGTITVTDGLGAVRTHSFEVKWGVARNTAITGDACPACGPASASYDANGYLLTRTDWNDNRTNYTYDSRGLETQRVEGLTSAGATTPQTRTISTLWHATLRAPVKTAGPRRMTTYVYNGDSGANCGVLADGKTLVPAVLCSKTDVNTTDPTGSQGLFPTVNGDPRTWAYTYDKNASVLTENGPRADAADVTTNVYDPISGNLTKTTDALDHETNITGYNAHGLPTNITDASGIPLVLDYDARQRLISRTVRAEVTSYEYFPNGTLKKITRPDGSFLSFLYDSAQRLTRVTDALGNYITYTLDAAGNRTGEHVFKSDATEVQGVSRVYSVLNRLDQEIGAVQARQQITQYTYDNQGNLRFIKRDPDGFNVSTEYRYDALNRVHQIVAPDGGVTGVAYDGLDQVKTVTDPWNNVTTYTVNGVGNLTKIESPDSGVTSLSNYDRAGNARTKTDAKGEVLTYVYDELNRLTTSGGATGPNTTRYYDPLNAVGRLKSIEDRDAAGNIVFTGSFSYNPQGRLERKVDIADTRVLTLEYTYDSFGRVAKKKYPSGRELTFTYDSAGNVLTVSVDGESIASAIGYHPFGKPNSWEWPLSAGYEQQKRNYDADGRLSSFTVGSSGTLRTVEYDKANRISRIYQGADERTFTYLDPGSTKETDRLYSFTSGTTTGAYAYDVNGNRTSSTIVAPPSTVATTYQYPAGTNRLSSTTSGSTTTAYGYTNAGGLFENGNVTLVGQRTFSYDGNQRLVETHSPMPDSPAAQYYVNGFGERVMKSATSSGTTTVTRFMYDETGKLVGEYTIIGRVIREYVYLGDMLLAVLMENEVILDNGGNANGATATTGTWSSSTDGTGHTGTNFRYALKDQIGTFTWTPSVPDNTSYNVYARIPIQSIATATNARYTVTHRDGTSAPILIDQTAQNAGEWVFLGTFNMVPGGGHSVKLTTDQVNGTVVADAIKIVNAPRNYFLRLIQANQVEAPLNVRRSTSQGAVLWSWDPAPFGDSAGNLGLNDDVDNDGSHFILDVRFPGQFFDTETALHYNYRRDYDPATGRYIQFDPIGRSGDANPYVYAASAPLSRTDPAGLYSSEVHQAMTLSAMQVDGHGLAFAQAVAGWVVNADWSPISSQAPSNAHWHGMCPSGWTRAQCAEAFDRFVEQQIRLCSTEGLGRAIHAAQDITARGHGLAAWSSWSVVLSVGAYLIGYPTGHRMGDAAPTGQEVNVAIERTRDVLRRYQVRCNCYP